MKTLALTFALCTVASLASANTIFLTTSEGGPAANVDATIDAGTTGQLYIYVQPSEVLNGISLDVVSSSDALKFTGATIPNFDITVAGTDINDRWQQTTQGAVAADGSAVTGLSGFSVNLGTGIDLANVGPTFVDGGYSASNGAFLLGTVDYAAGDDAGLADVFLQLGSNRIGAKDGDLGDVMFGFGDPAIDYVVGARSATPEAAFTIVGGPVIPEPATMGLATLAIAGALGFRRRR